MCLAHLHPTSVNTVPANVNTAKIAMTVSIIATVDSTSINPVKI